MVTKKKSKRRISKSAISQRRQLKFKPWIGILVVGIILVAGIVIIRLSNASSETWGLILPGGKYTTTSGGQKIDNGDYTVWRTSVNDLSPNKWQFYGPGEKLTVWPDKTSKKITSCVNLKDNLPYGVRAKFRFDVISKGGRAGVAIKNSKNVEMGSTKPFKTSSNGYEVICLDTPLTQAEGFPYDITKVEYRLQMQQGSVDITQISRYLTGTITSDIALPSIATNITRSPNPTKDTTKNDSLCLSRAGQKITLSGPQNSRYSNGYLSPNTVIDASKATWNGVDSKGVPIKWLITLDGEGPACWYGGKFTGVWDDKNDPAVTWSDPYHHSGAMTIRLANFLVENFRADNQGDGIRMESGGSNFHIRSVYLSNIHDDCIENDFLHSGLVENSLFDGCYVGVSADDFTKSFNGSKNTMKMINNLMYIKPFNTVYRGVSPGTGLFFKGWWQSPSPMVELKNNIFRFDSDSGFGKLSLPTGLNLQGCSNNTIVWAGKGKFPYTFPDCFKVTTDVSVWDNAVAQWKIDHPTVK